MSLSSDLRDDYRLSRLIPNARIAQAEALEAERDRYREALEKIGDESRMNIQKAWDAREALGQKPGPA